MLAGRLAGLGAGPEAVVAVVLGRRIARVAAVLAVSRAGAAFLPVDPGYPAGRIAVDAGRCGPGGDRGRHGLAAALPVQPQLAMVPVLVTGDPAWRARPKPEPEPEPTLERKPEPEPGMRRT